jgi:hypothetical protein
MVDQVVVVEMEILQQEQEHQGKEIMEEPDHQVDQYLPEEVEEPVQLDKQVLLDLLVEMVEMD